MLFGCPASKAFVVFCKVCIGFLLSLEGLKVTYTDWLDFAKQIQKKRRSAASHEFGV